MASTTEERLSTLEAEVEQLKRLLQTVRPGVVGRTAPHFLETFVGIFADDPDFDAMDTAIQQERDAERKKAAHLGDAG